MSPSIRLAILASHPVQYYAPMFRELAKRVDLHVFYAHSATPEQQAAAGFGRAFEWDIPLTEGYSFSFLNNISKRPGTDWFGGCDTPEIYDLLKGGHFTVVLTLGWHLKSMIQGVFAAKRLGLPILVRGDSQLSTPRSLIKRWVKALVYPILLRAFDAALYVGKNNYNYWRAYGFPTDRLFHSPHCVETERFARGATLEARSTLRKRLNINPASFVVLFAGKLLPFKRPLDVVRAVAMVRAEGLDCRVMVAGSGPLEAELIEEAKATEVPLDLLGFQNQSEMPAAYAAADLLVLPSTGRETWGLVANEALASGLPIAVSDQVGCAPDLATNSLAGRTFEMGQVASLAYVIIRSSEDAKSADDIQKLSDQYSISAALDGIVSSIAFVSKTSRKMVGH
ncbi:MAG: glycosyltransferase family 4 protein [Aquidulcibacter sp.]|nr:glycosyltransferase family 4 protein [Aquidulcibacter sp.]